MLLDKLEFGLLAFKAEDDVFYVHPSGWQRIYLLWTFRHFHSLPVKLLNARQRALVENLYRSSVPRFSGRQERTHILGIVEDVHSGLAVRSAATAPAPANRALRRPILVPVPAPDAVPISSEPTDAEIAELIRKEDLHDTSHQNPSHETLSRENLGRRNHRTLFAGLPWARIGQAVSVTAACTLVAILGWRQLQASQRLHVALAAMSDHRRQPQWMNASTQTPVDPTPIERPGVATAATTARPTAPAPQTAPAAPTVPSSTAFRLPVLSPQSQTALAPSAQPRSAQSTLAAKLSSSESQIASSLVARAGQSISLALKPAQPIPAPSTPATDPTAQVSSIATSVASEPQPDSPLLLVSRPPLKLIYPTSPEGNLRGSVSLQAVLSTDGTVQTVKVVSGNRVLADAAIRAVREWRYTPYYRDGHAVGTETNIRISFIASDAVSISFPAVASVSQ